MSLDLETTTGYPTTSTSSPVARAGSPTAARKAQGKPTPPPLSFEPSLTSSDALPSDITSLTSPPYSAPSKQRHSPFTPDRPSPSTRSRAAQRSPLSPMDSQTRSTAGRNGTRRVASEGNDKNSEGSDGYRSVEGVNRLGKLPASASSSGRPRNAQSVLGYSSLAKKGLSPGRGSKSEGLSGGVAVAPAPQGANNSSRYLLTVIPPSHLPHDPPHPRTNPQCSGYGPPEHFKRGTLVPLYPTLSSQLAAIAREYGLPSTGGLVVYLLSTIDPSSAVPQPLPGSSGFAGEGGPRISEAAWSLLWSRLFEEEEEVYLVAEDTLSDEEDYAPPVPPIPRSHQALDDDDDRSRQPSEEQAIFSADEDNERTSFSSDAEDASSRYEKSEGRQASGSGGSRSFSNSRNGIGRGPPPSLPSPNHGPRPSHRFSQSQQRYVSLPNSANSTNQRHSSRNSLRSARTGLPAYYYPSPAQSRSASYGSYAPSHVSTPPTPGYGASVIVGKVEFDIDRSRAQGGKGKWYDAWVEGAVPTEATPPVGTATEAPSTHWQELQLPELVKSKTINPFGFSDSFTPPFSSSDDNHDTRARTISGTSRGMESATSAWSLAAMAERVEQREAKQAQDIEEEEVQGENSIVDKEPVASERSASPLRSRPISNASTAVLESEKDMEETEEEAEVQDQGYSQLEDDDEMEPLKAGSFSDDSEEQAGSDESSEYGGTGGQEEEEARRALEEGKDPLGDVFESDEATWQALAADSTQPRLNETASIETTGLGIVGTRIAELAPTAPEGVLERSTEEQASLESEQSLPPQDDVAEVFSMLHSAQAAATSSGPLASPIRLEHSPSDTSESTTFPPPREVDDSESHRNSPFTMSHSTNTSVSTVNFNVRPPSTIASMSPEYVPQRKQRQGWTNVPAVVDPSLSTSSSSSSIALLDSQRASTIGLMENLDDLERALAELSPRANKAKATQQAEAIPEEPTPPASEESHTSTASFPRPPRSSSRDVSSEEQGPTRFESSSHLSPSLEDRPGLLSTSSYASEESFVTATATETSPIVEPIRIPRSSSLSKAKMDEGQSPHLVALPPSPLPPSPSSMNSNEAADDHTPTVDTANSETWSILPPSPPRLPVTLPESDLPPVPPKVEDVAPFAAASPSTTRSPGPIKSLRMNKPWGNKESRSIKTQVSPDPGSEEPSVPKSPLGSFFGKSTFGKAKGFFKKSEASQDGHTSITSPATSPNLPASSLPNDAAPPPVRKDSLDVPSYSLPAIERMPDSTATPAPAETTPLVHPTPTPFASVTESVHSGPSSRPDSPFYNEATPDYPPGTSTTSPPVLSPGSTLSPTSTSFPQPPSTRPFATSPSTSDFNLSSPRSEYIPQTPRAGFANSPSNNSQYPASAPVTPAEWPNSRFGAASTPGSERGKRKPRLSADIDQLLSQMNDINFGIGGDDDDDEDDYGAPEKAEPPSTEVKREDSEVVSPLLVEPTNPLESEAEQSGGSSQSHELRQQDNGMLGVQGNAHRGILSADLSALGSMMTGFASPPLSPDQSSSSLHHIS